MPHPNQSVSHNTKVSQNELGFLLGSVAHIQSCSFQFPCLRAEHLYKATSRVPEGSMSDSLLPQHLDVFLADLLTALHRASPTLNQHGLETLENKTVPVLNMYFPLIIGPHTV